MMRRIFFCCLLLVLLLCGGKVDAQRPCRDTLVHVYDTICTDQTYDFNGLTLTYQGVFWDTVPRVLGPCDSVIVLHLAVLEYPYSVPSVVRSCRGTVGYHLYASFGTYYRWSSEPHDPMLDDVGCAEHVFVSPSVPTTYSLYTDWRSTPQCPAEASVRLNPITPVRAAMKVWPKDLVYDNMQITVEDCSLGNQEAPYGGWAGRNWYLNGQQQAGQGVYEQFQVQPWFGDSVVVMMEAYNSDCLDTVVKVIPFLKGALHFPDIFFPSQQTNNLFFPIHHGVSNYQLRIYDRAGVLVFQSTDVQQPWDGTHLGRPCKSGAYVYHCIYTTTEVPNGYQNQVGTITLVR